MFSNFVLNRAFCEMMRKKIMETDRPQVTVWRMRIACWIPRGKDTNSEHAVLMAVLLQQWLEGKTAVCCGGA